MSPRILHTHTPRSGIPWAGLAAGPIAWWLNAQLSYALLNWACNTSLNPAPVLATVFAAISIGGAYLSWRAWSRYLGPGIQVPDTDGYPGYLLCGLGVATGVLFAAVIIMQGIAGMFLDPCLR